MLLHKLIGLGLSCWPDPGILTEGELITADLLIKEALFVTKAKK